MFYQKFIIHSISKYMIYEHHAASVVHKKNNCKTILTYFSNTEPEVSKEISTKTLYFEFAYMNFDYLISSQISIDFLKASKSNIGSFVSLGPLFSDFSFLSQHTKDKIRSTLNIPKDKKIITFFDNTFGYNGISTFEEHEIFIEAINQITKKNCNHFIIYRPKKIIIDTNYLKLTAKLYENSNFIQIDKNFNFLSEELIGVSDLVVSSPFSSIQTDTLSVNKKLITFEPDIRFRKYNSFINNLPKCKANTIDELNYLVKYWLNTKSENEFDILKKIVSEKYTINNTGDLIKRYKNFIYNIRSSNEK